MPSLFSPETFNSFGPDEIHIGRSHPPLVRVQGSRPSNLHSHVRLDCPKRPGVYGMLDGRGELLYIGKAKDLRSRLLSYFRTKSRDPKAGDIIRHTRTLAWEVLPTEFSALLRELELIRRWQPRYNLQGRPRRGRPVWLCLGRHPAPHAFIATRIPSTARTAFGPLPNGPRTYDAARRINDLFGLRDCPHPQEMHFAEQQNLFPIVRTPGCIRHELGRCLAPCASLCTHADYDLQMRAADEFLKGTDLSPLERLEQEEAAAAWSLQFERAAVLRDRLQILRWLQQHLDRMKLARGLTFIYPLAGYDGREWWYLLERGQVRAVVAKDSREVPDHLEAVYGRKQSNVERVESMLLAATWFRKKPSELDRGLSVKDAKVACGLTRER